MNNRTNVTYQTLETAENVYKSTSGNYMVVDSCLKKTIIKTMQIRIN